MIGILSYGIGNVEAIRNMLYRLGIKAVICTTPEMLEQSEKYILPGVGAFDHGMNCLRSSGLLEPLRQLVVEQKRPLLGICLGMQLLGENSEEGTESGLGWLPVSFRKFEGEKTPGCKTMHMGWNSVKPTRPHQLFNEFTSDPRFYFVHRYHAVCESEFVLGLTQFGDVFPSVITHENIIGVQFHPEKSHKYGMKLLTNFSRLT